jgi:glycerophosphoryl diester phosphodiesterase
MRRWLAQSGRYGAVMAPAFAFLDHPGPLAFAHRGGAALNPENTWASFAHAVSLGYRYLETDARLTRDGVVLAFHDATLERVADRPGTIAHLPWHEVRRARIAGEHEPVRLDELLEAYPEIRINIDAKEDAVVEPLARVIERMDAVERVCIASFSDARLARARAILGAGLCTSAGPRGVARLRLAASGAPVRPPRLACVQVPVRARGVRLVDARFVAAAHRAGIAVHVWTIDDRDEMDRLLDLGVDGLMTDRPDLLRSALVARDQWF